VSLLAASPEARAPLARWLGFADEAGFWAEYCRQLAETRQIVLSLLPQQP